MPESCPAWVGFGRVWLAASGWPARRGHRGEVSRYAPPQLATKWRHLAPLAASVARARDATHGIAGMSYCAGRRDIQETLRQRSRGDGHGRVPRVRSTEPPAPESVAGSYLCGGTMRLPQRGQPAPECVSCICSWLSPPSNNNLPSHGTTYLSPPPSPTTVGVRIRGILQKPPEVVARWRASTGKLVWFADPLDNPRRVFERFL